MSAGYVDFDIVVRFGETGSVQITGRNSTYAGLAEVFDILRTAGLAASQDMPIIRPEQGADSNPGTTDSNQPAPVDDDDSELEVFDSRRRFQRVDCPDCDKNVSRAQLTNHRRYKHPDKPAFLTPDELHPLVAGALLREAEASVALDGETISVVDAAAPAVTKPAPTDEHTASCDCIRCHVRSQREAHAAADAKRAADEAVRIQWGANGENPPRPTVRPPRPHHGAMSEVRAIGTRRTNAALIVDCRTLGYLADDWHTLDPTHGLGRWWTHWQPASLVRHDLDPTRAPDGPMDFRALTYDDATFDAVTFDPPYKLNGTGGSHASDHAYGVDIKGVRWQDKMQLCLDGITEAIRVTKPGGMVLVKCQDQVCSGQVRWQRRVFAEHAEARGCRHVDELHVVGYRRQPAGRQVHARRDHSTLLVLMRER